MALIRSRATGLRRLFAQLSLLAYLAFLTVLAMMVLTFPLAGFLSFWRFQFLMLDTLPPSSTARKALFALMGPAHFLPPIITLALTVGTILVLLMLALARFIKDIRGGQALAPTSAIPVIVRSLSRGTLVIRPPRFCPPDCFWDTGLCVPCQAAIRSSSLLLGSRLGLAKTAERIPVYDSIQEMQRSWRQCHFCESLLGQKDERPLVESAAVLDHWRLEDPRVFLQIEYRPHESQPIWASLALRNSSALFSPINIREGTIYPMVERRDADDVEGIAMVRFWISKCLKHRMCSGSTSLSPTYLPSRLLYVCTSGTPALRLIANAAADRLDMPDDRYVALSHCWGGKIDFRLRMDNHASMSVAIHEHSLPENFSDAIKITRGLGVRYLWIDSLCIVQDSISDWEAESPMMGHIFANAHCVIAATASENFQGGCLRGRRVRDYSNRRALIRSGSTYCYTDRSYPSVRTLFDTRVEQAPLTQRAWAFQERLLAPRVVQFASDTLLFECNTLQASEHDPRGVGYEKESYAVQGGKLVAQLELSLTKIGRRFNLPAEGEDVDVLARRGIRGALDVLQSLGFAALHTKAERVEFVRRWFDVVAAYSERALTRQTDKLVALSGVAELVQERAGVPYLAGLWHLEGFALPLQLLWVIKKAVRRQPLYCAPSWSWASVQGLAELLPLSHLSSTTSRSGSENLTSPADIISATVSWRGSSVASARDLLDTGKLIIRAPTWEARNENPRLGSLTLYETHRRPYTMSAGSGTQKMVRYRADTKESVVRNNTIAIHLITATRPGGIYLEYGLDRI
ncbi:HET-domain-containing protein [Podospora aff. communis PSN243]|uniref:HET-domain-containing protein n=1 Tax=Podospora aff. communis PSN243 TaxID=3040156 RepID=A0AAV9G6B4_9PEZI|nr:HET-domain-containing protein [Podospora aff. communis PSN243]